MTLYKATCAYRELDGEIYTDLESVKEGSINNRVIANGVGSVAIDGSANGVVIQTGKYNTDIYSVINTHIGDIY